MYGEHCRLLSSAVDYVRVTSKPGEASAQLSSAYKLLRQGLQSALHEVGTWQWKQYEGEQIGSLRFGSRGDGCLLQCSGAWAAVVFSAINSLDVQYTRLDLQETWYIGEDVDAKLRGMEPGIQAWSVHNPRKSRPKPRMVEGYGNGNTFYLGAPGGRYFGRVYNKSLESPGDYGPDVIRYEVQFENEGAQSAAAALQVTQQLDSAIAGIVHGWWEERGVELPEYTGAREVVRVVPKDKTTDEKSLEWLQKSIRPTVQRLIDRGHYDKVIAALFYENDNHSHGDE